MTLPARLLDRMKPSYREHNRTNKFLDNAFWGSNPTCECTWPQTMWAGLDRFPNPALSAMTQVAELVDSEPGLWQKFDRIRNSWSDPRSRGFQVRPTGLESYVRDPSQNFCKDNPSSARSWHGTELCWRQMGRAGVPGLHICLKPGAEEIHVDPHQATNATRDPDGSCNWNLLGWLKHTVPVPSKFEAADARLDGVGQRITRLRTEARARCTGAYLARQEAELSKVGMTLASTRRKVRQDAMGGFQGEIDGAAFANRQAKVMDWILNAIERDIDRCGGSSACIPARPGGEVVAAATPTVGPTVQATPDDPPTLVGLRRGDGLDWGTEDRRPRVTRLQERLNANKASLQADGKFGTNTSRALAAFQAGHGLTPRPVVDASTAHLLEGSTPRPDHQPATVQGLTRGDGLTYGTWERRPRVEVLQVRLTVNGHPANADGMFGDRTLAALNAFRTVRLLPAAGPAVDPVTAEALFDNGGGQVCPVGQQPEPATVANTSLESLVEPLLAELERAL